MHSWEVSAFREALGERGDDALIAAMKAFKPVTHKVVRVNPDSGRNCLFVNSDFTRHIIGIDRHEAVGILRFLLEWMKKTEFMAHHQWEPHGIAIWDNRSTQHYAGADYWPHHRVNQRVTFDGPGSTTQDSVNVNERVLKSQGLQQFFCRSLGARVHANARGFGPRPCLSGPARAPTARAGRR